MPRPRPPEELVTVGYRLTRSQARKVQQMGGPTWLRQLISSASPGEHRDPVEHLRFLSARNKALAADPRPTKELIHEYKLSKQQINAIRRKQNA